MKFKSLREWINRDDGKHWQVGNHKLNFNEILGYGALIGALLIYLLNDKLGFQHTWVGWLLLFIGVIFTISGTSKGIDKKNT